MKTFVLNLTNRCNFRCEHCFREEASKEDLPLELLERCLPTLRAIGVHTLALTGGEPILHPRFSELLERCAEHGFRIGLVTNGSLTTRYLEALAPHRERIAYVALSLDGATAALHDELRHRAGSFQHVLESIARLREAGYAVNVSHVLSKKTASAAHLRALAELLAERAISTLAIGAVVPAPRNQAVRPGEPRALAAGLALVRSKLGNRLRLTPALGQSRQLAFCPNLVTGNDASLRYDGEVVFCCDCVAGNRGASLGNVRDEPLLEILARHPERAARLLQARLEALLRGEAHRDNDCAFCNRMLDQLGPPRLRLPVLGPGEPGPCASEPPCPPRGADVPSAHAPL